MSKASKWIAIIIGIIIALIVIFFIVVAFIARSVDFKSILIKQVKERTGRDLVIKGKLAWHVFPTASVSVNQATLSSPPSFGDTPFMKVNKINVSLDTWALIGGKIRIEEFNIDGANINLVKNAKGMTNWDMTPPKPTTVTQETKSMAFATQPAQPATGDQNKKTQTHGSQYSVDIPNLQITHANVSWNNQQTGQALSLQDVTLKASDIRQDKAFPVSFSVNVNNAKPQIVGSVSLASKVMFGSNGIALNGFEFKTSLKGDALPNKALNSDVMFNLNTTGKTASLNNFKATMNGTNITGDVSITDLQNLVGTFKFNVDQINLDPYLAAMNALTQNKKPQAKLAKSAQASKVSQPTAKKSQENIAASSASVKLPPMHLTGRLTIGRLVVNKATITAIKAPMSLINGVFSIKPFSASLYKGSINGELDADLNAYQYDFNGQLQNVELGQLLQDMYGYQKFTGDASANINVTTHGMKSDDTMKNLNGKGSFNVKNGAYTGLDVAYLYRKFLSVIRPKFVKPGDDSGVTKFGHLSGDFMIKQGVFNSNNILAQSPVLKATAKGYANLVNQQINWQLVITALQGSLDNPKPVGPAIPLNITGTFKNHQIKPDFQGLLQDTLKQNLQDNLQKNLKKGLKNVDIGGLFG